MRHPDRCHISLCPSLSCTLVRYAGKSVCGSSLSHYTVGSTSGSKSFPKLPFRTRLPPVYIRNGFSPLRTRLPPVSVRTRVPPVSLRTRVPPVPCSHYWSNMNRDHLYHTPPRNGSSTFSWLYRSLGRARDSPGSSRPRSLLMAAILQPLRLQAPTLPM